MEFCLNFSLGLITPLLMLVIRNLVLLHKVKSKEAMLYIVEQYADTSYSSSQAVSHHRGTFLFLIKIFQNI